MNRNILWNGFELRKGTIKTSAGNVPYIMYSPEISIEPVTIAIHRETSSKEDWLCFNSVYRGGNLLKESIKSNSVFIAFDLYGHGEWKADDPSFNVSDIKNSKTLIERSSRGIQEAVKFLLESEKIADNPVTIVGNSVGCSVVLNLIFPNIDFKTVLLSPFNTTVNSSSTKYLIHRGNRDKIIPETEFKKLIEKLPNESEIILYNKNHDLDENWIYSTKNFIYSGSRVG